MPVQKNIFVASVDIQHDTNNYIQQINKITQPCPEILALSYFRACWACPGMPVQTQQILHDFDKYYHQLLQAFMDT